MFHPPHPPTRINNHNEEFAAGKWTYTAGINQFADLTEEEFTNMYLSRPLNGNLSAVEANTIYMPTKDVPNDIDWRLRGAVTPVKSELGAERVVESRS